MVPQALFLYLVLLCYLLFFCVMPFQFGPGSVLYDTACSVFISQYYKNKHLAMLYVFLHAVLCIVVCLLPWVESVNPILIRRCSWTAKSCHKRSWSCCFSWKWVVVSRLWLWFIWIAHVLLNIVHIDGDFVLQIWWVIPCFSWSSWFQFLLTNRES